MAPENNAMRQKRSNEQIRSGGGVLSDGEDSTDEKDFEADQFGNLQTKYKMLNNVNQDLANVNIFSNLACPSSEDENDFLAADDLNVEEDFGAD